MIRLKIRLGNNNKAEVGSQFFASIHSVSAAQSLMLGGSNLTDPTTDCNLLHTRDEPIPVDSDPERQELSWSLPHSRPGDSRDFYLLSAQPSSCKAALEASSSQATAPSWVVYLQNFKSFFSS